MKAKKVYESMGDVLKPKEGNFEKIDVDNVYQSIFKGPAKEWDDFVKKTFIGKTITGHFDKWKDYQFEPVNAVIQVLEASGVVIRGTDNSHNSIIFKDKNDKEHEYWFRNDMGGELWIKE